MKIALVGNPNVGKSSLFNQLTGLNQKVGNFAGVTVEKKTGKTLLPGGIKAEFIDLPGTYSLHPKSLDEKIVLDVLLNPADPDYPDLVLIIVDASNLKRNLLLFTEIADLQLPTILVLNMVDMAENSQYHIDYEKLQKKLNIPVITTNARNSKGVQELKQAISEQSKSLPQHLNGDLTGSLAWLKEIEERFHTKTPYQSLLYAHHFEQLQFLNDPEKDFLQRLILQENIHSFSLQKQETLQRFQVIDQLLQGVVHKKNGISKNVHAFSSKLDKILLHPIWGYLVFILILAFIFQLIFHLAEYPMQWIEQLVASTNSWLTGYLPPSLFTSLLTDGIIAGLGGIIVFIPQIALLFAVIAILEESGYMARVMVITDKIMRRFGLNGKSVVPLISGLACAIPAVMATRNIDNWKERVTTILVTPLMACSARIPVYTIIIALVIPDKFIAGFLSVRGLVMLGMYFLGTLMALLVALILKYILKAKQKGYFIMEMPIYRMPRWKNVGISIWEKVKTFVWDAGKVIIVISLVLWILANFGPSNQMQQAEQNVIAQNSQLSDEALANAVASARLEASFAGHLGKFIEPLITPLGYDWKIGIALISSFAAREVFVGTMATIYSLGSTEEEKLLREKMAEQINPNTGKKVYTLATGVSLLLFYAFAMQCMSTLAIVYRETGGWKYPVIQLIYMTGLAYLLAMLAYQLLK